MDYKLIIIESLDVLRKRDQANKEPFKARAYQTVINQLKQYDGPIHTFDQVKTMKGVGEKIQEKIKEIMETGHLQSAERAKEKYAIDSLDAFQNIYGVGPAKATDLVKQGYRTIEQLRTAVSQNASILNDKQKVGLKYYEELLERIPREEMDQHRAKILSHFAPTDQVDIVGSYRRGKETSGDIDVLILEQDHPIKINLHPIVNQMQTTRYIEEVLALGEHKCMAICRLPNGKARRLDLLMTPAKEYAYSLLYFTGSDRFNVAFRQFALQCGYTLNEHTMTPVQAGRPIPPYMETEKDIFHFLNLRYINPVNRVDEKQICMKKPKIGVELS